MDAEFQRQFRASPTPICEMVANTAVASSARVRPIASTEPEE